MSAFELKIYGENDEVLKTFSTDRIRWGVFLQAIESHEAIAGLKPQEQYALVDEFVKKLFPGITDDEIKKAEAQDVLNLFWMLVGKVNRIGVGAKKK